jgi:hypothetical protein
VGNKSYAGILESNQESGTEDAMKKPMTVKNETKVTDPDGYEIREGGLVLYRGQVWKVTYVSPIGGLELWNVNVAKPWTVVPADVQWLSEDTITVKKKEKAPSGHVAWARAAAQNKGYSSTKHVDKDGVEYWIGGSSVAGDWEGWSKWSKERKPVESEELDSDGKKDTIQRGDLIREEVRRLQSEDEPAKVKEKKPPKIKTRKPKDW